MKKFDLVLIAVVLVMTVVVMGANAQVVQAQEPVSADEFIQACFDIGGVSMYVGEHAFCVPLEMMPALQVASGNALPVVPDVSVMSEPEVCRLDKIGTWSEGNDPHRIEVRGHGPQHVDFYPKGGV